ncbi:MAG: hypothetical protein ACTSUE_18150 [Promethearchaeota archaeon]
MEDFLNMIKNQANNFMFASNKVDVLLNIFINAAITRNDKRGEALVHEIDEIIEGEKIDLEKSKILRDGSRLLLRFYGIPRVKSLADRLIQRIENPFFRIEIKLKRLRIVTQRGSDCSTIEKLLNDAREDLIISTPGVKESSRNLLHQRLCTIMSQIGLRLSNLDYFKKSIDLSGSITFEYCREETMKDVFNNLYLLAIKRGDTTLVESILEESRTSIKDDAFWIETLYNYSRFCKKHNQVAKIEKIIEDILEIIHGTDGEYSRSAMLKQVILISINLGDPAITKAIETRIMTVVENLHGNFTKCLLKLELARMHTISGDERAALSALKEGLIYSFQMNEDELFMRFFEKMTAFLDEYPGILTEIDDERKDERENLINFTIDKLKEIRETPSKVYFLVNFTSRLNGSEAKKLDVENFLEQFMQPYVHSGMVQAFHIYQILKFKIHLAFEMDDQTIINNPRDILSEAPRNFEQCMLILDLLHHYKKAGNDEKIRELAFDLLNMSKKLVKEFEKKEILVKFIQFTRNSIPED